MQKLIIAPARVPLLCHWNRMPATRAPIPPKPLVILNETEWSEESQSGGRRKEERGRRKEEGIVDLLIRLFVEKSIERSEIPRAEHLRANQLSAAKSRERSDSGQFIEGGRRNGLRPEEIGNTTAVKQIN
ncbi:MAG: hypothetical protein K9I34_06475 [Bacteroidales bacterium]|nr:hypothetical protein [Bacteroidales bacterium]